MVSMADALAPYMEKAKQRLAELGQETEEDEPKCPKCADAGFVRRVVEVGHPDFGQVLPRVQIINNQLSLNIIFSIFNYVGKNPPPI
jgi:hypothetical protein